MSIFHVNKPKSAAKIMMPPTDKLRDEVTETLSYIAQMVGATLGPGGRQVLIERPEMGMEPIVTKDGVTVIKHLGFQSATQQLILETARSAALRTASEAGDGTTTATILSDSITRSTSEVVKYNTRISPQKIVREMQKLVPYILSFVERNRIDINGENFDSLLMRVATLSANGDTELAAQILEAFNMVGEEGNLTIVEHSGESKYVLERIKGYTVDMGYEDSLKNFANGFINDKSGTLIKINNPIILLYDGVITDVMQVFDAMTKLGNYFQRNRKPDNNVVLFAHGFSETVLATLYENWTHPQAFLHALPIVTPQNGIHNGRSDFLVDLKAYTGMPIFNPLDKPLCDLDEEALVAMNRTKEFECSRFKSSIISDEDADIIDCRVFELKERMKTAPSELEYRDLEVRIGKLTSGIARLNIYAPSPGESREKRDRCDDAWMAINGAAKKGAVPGGGWMLVKLAGNLTCISHKMSGTQRMAAEILADAFLKPVRVLYQNYGYNEEETEAQILELLNNEEMTFDVSEQKWVAIADLLDSVPALTEAIRNSISIASLLGTIGGIISFKRDGDADQQERNFARGFEKTINSE